MLYVVFTSVCGPHIRNHPRCTIAHRRTTNAACKWPCLCRICPGGVSGATSCLQRSTSKKYRYAALLEFANTSTHTRATQDAVQQFGVKGLPGVQCYKDGVCVENTVYATSHEVLTSLKTHGGEPPASRRSLPGWARVALQTVVVRQRALGVSHPVIMIMPTL